MRTLIVRGASSFGLCLALGAGASAQQLSMFDVDPSLSNFTWSGTTSVGAITPNPAAFQIDGTTGMALYTGGNPIGSAAFTNTGSAFLVPNTLSGSVSIFATMDITGLTFTLASTPFAVGGAGNFAATVTGTATGGTMTVTPAFGAPTVTDVTGLSSTPSLSNGTLTTVGMTHTLSMPLNATFPFSDPGSGITGSITLLGTATATATNPNPTTFCAANANSTGFPGEIGWTGTTSIAADDLQLTATNLPMNKNGIFYLGTGQIQAPFHNGFRCVDLNVVRLGVINTGSGTVSLDFDYDVLPGLQAGDTRHFQFWHRDVGPNLTNGLTVPFAP